MLEMSQFYCILCVFSRVYFAYFITLYLYQFIHVYYSICKFGGLVYEPEFTNYGIVYELAVFIAFRIADAYLTDRRFLPAYFYLS